MFSGCKLGTNDMLGGLHHPLQGFIFFIIGHCGAAIPLCNAVGQDAVSGAAIETSNDEHPVEKLLEKLQLSNQNRKYYGTKAEPQNLYNDL